MKNILLAIAALLVLSISALFFAQNDSMVEVKYFAGTLHWQMNWILSAMFVVGLLTGVLITSTSLISTKVKLANTKRKLERQKREIENLRVLPAKDKY